MPVLTKLSLVLIACFALQACTALLIGGAGGTANDAAIATAVNARFASDDMVRSGDIHVVTHGTVVTLRGKVDSPEARLRAIELAYGVRHVTRVIADELIVEGK